MMRGLGSKNGSLKTPEEMLGEVLPETYKKQRAAMLRRRELEMKKFQKI